MGGIFSKLGNYIQTKVNDTKQGIENRINYTNNAISTRIENAQNAVVGRINAAGDAVCQSVDNTRKGIIRLVENTKNAVTTRYTNCKMAVVDHVTRVVNTVTYVKDTVVTSVTNTKNAIVTNVTNMKNAVVTTYTNTKENAYNRYRRIREAKLTRWQKFTYSVLGVFLLIVLATLFLLSLDVYFEEFDRAHERLVAIRSLLVYTWEISLILLKYLIYCMFFGARKACIILASWSHTAGVYLVFAAGVLWENLKSGFPICWDQTLNASILAWGLLKTGTQISAEYATIGARLAFTYGLLICLCWAGLMKNRSRYVDDEEEDDENDDEESDGGRSEGSDEDDSKFIRSTPKAKVSKFVLVPMEEPPSYDIIENLPSYDQATRLTEDDFPSSSEDEDEEFDLGQGIPDFIDSDSDLSENDLLFCKNLKSKQPAQILGCP